MTGEYVTSVHNQIERYTRETDFEPQAHDSSHYLRRIQDVRERTYRWDADRLRSGTRRIAGLSYQDTIRRPEGKHPPGRGPRRDPVAVHIEMRRSRDADIARRRQPVPQPRVGSLYGRRVERPPFLLDLSSVGMTPAAGGGREGPEAEPAVASPDLDILRRLLCTPSRVLATGTSPLARLGSAAAPDPSPSKSPPVVVPSAASSPGARLPPVRGRLLPMSVARSLRSAQRNRLEDSLKTTRLPFVDSGAQQRRGGAASGGSIGQHPARAPAAGHDLHGFRIYQHLMGAETQRANSRVAAHRHAMAASRGVATETIAVQQVVGPGVARSSPVPGPDRHPLLPLPSFPITQLLSQNPDAAGASPRVDYISINVAIPRADNSRPQTGAEADPMVSGLMSAEETFVPPPSPANPGAGDIEVNQVQEAEEEEAEEENDTEKAGADEEQTKEEE